MRKFLLVATLFASALAGQAQETVMNTHKKDGTTTQTRAAELKQISFLTVDEGGQGLIVTTLGGETATVLFEAKPVVTVGSGKLIIKPSAADAVEFEISDIKEIRFGDASDGDAVSTPRGFDFVVQEGGALLRGLPKGVKPRVYTLDGRSLPTPPVRGGELRLSRSSLGSGVFIVKAGSFSAKIKL